jgi:hypothetical protein
MISPNTPAHPITRFLTTNGPATAARIRTALGYRPYATGRASRVLVDDQATLQQSGRITWERDSNTWSAISPAA